MTNWQDEIISVTEAAKLKGVSVRTVQWWITTGLLPAKRLTREYALRAEDVRAFTPARGKRSKRKE